MSDVANFWVVVGTAAPVLLLAQAALLYVNDEVGFPRVRALLAIATVVASLVSFAMALEALRGSSPPPALASDLMIGSFFVVLVQGVLSPFASANARADAAGAKVIRLRGMLHVAEVEAEEAHKAAAGKSNN
jgi:hypothetical protein